MEAETKPAQDRVNCFQCFHFFITWDKTFPHGCKVYGFKTKQLPSIAVQQASGAGCAAFQPKQQNRRSD